MQQTSPAPTARTDSAWIALALLGSLTAILVARNPAMVTTPQLWNEDLWVFLQGQREFGAAAMLQPYQGYLHLFPRIVAHLAGALPLDFIPWCYAAGSLGAWLWVGWRFLRSPLFTHQSGAALTVIAIGLMPQNGEVVLILTNAQWILAVGLTLLIVQPVEERTRAHDLVFATCAALSGPFSVLLLPLVGWRMWTQAKVHRRLDRVALGVTIGAALQGLCLALFSDRLRTGNTVEITPLIRALLEGPAGFLTIPKLILRYPSTWVLSLVGVVGGIFFATSNRWPGAGPRRRLMLAGGILLVSGVTASLAAFQVAPTVQGHSGRYLFVPCALFVISLVLTWENLPRRSVWQVVPIALLLLVLACSLRKFQAPRYPVSDWAAVCRELAAGQPVRIQAWPSSHVTVELLPPGSSAVRTGR